eukprot:c38877_g1_i1.p1 GENE.c38877_g1_i1~~c38877_g1_i1.p1  ORF type:complete len:123 (+),score=16.43 c38877_g1_i1:1-369(+)
MGTLLTLDSTMCRDCVKSERPDRGTTCLETGAFFMNFRGCAACTAVNIAVIDREAEEDDEGNETVSFTHVCGACNHVIGKHDFTCEVIDRRHEYSMECRLCGIGSDSRGIMPDDPEARLVQH